MTDFHTHDTGVSWRALISASSPLPGRLVSLEFHPCKIEEDSLIPDDFQKKLAGCAALGEVGFDALRGNQKRQLELLPQLLSLAVDNNKPVVLHLVRAHEGVFELLEKFPLRYLLHGFRGKAEKLASFLDRNWFVSLGRRGIDDPGVAELLRRRGVSHIGFESDDSGEDISGIIEYASQRLGIPDLEARCDREFELFLRGDS